MNQKTKESKNPNPFATLFAMLWRYSEGRRGFVVLYFGLSILAQSIWALQPLVIGFLLNRVQAGIAPSDFLEVLAILSILVLTEAGGWALHGPSRYIENKNAFFAKQRYKEHLLAGTMALPLEWHSDHHSGDTIDKIEKGTNAVFNFSENTFQIISVVVTLITGIAALLYFDLFATLAVLVFVIPTFFILALFDKHLISGYKKVSALENETTAKVFDTLSNVTTVIILRVEPLVEKAISAAIRRPLGQFLSNVRINEWKWFSAAVLGHLAAMAVIAAYIWHQFSLGAVMVGTVYILYGYVDRIRNTFFQFAGFYNDIIRWRAYVANAEELSSQFKSRRASGENRLPKGWNTLSIRGLSFSYPTASEEVSVADMTLDITKGERIALIGESGGGKSTLLKLMRDLYHPKSLTLSVDGIPVSGGFVDISDSISLVPQDPEIFSTTIRENITLGVEYPETHIKVFTDMAEFTAVGERLPKKLESSVVEKGVNLSGGEKQRLALTRGLLASEHKDIVLLDEPTSSVDFGNELKIYQNVFESFPKKTVISSIHRLHLLSLFDTVYLLQKGRIVARGSFEELKESSAEFKELWDKYVKSRDAVKGV